MANIMSLKNVRNKASRNGFDLSRRTCFTSKVGELLPVWWQYVLPGDSFEIDLSSFTRTQPVNTASFGRVVEYYDFFFVPLSQLWNRAPTVLTQMLDNNQHATGLQSNVKLDGDLPSLDSLGVFNQYCQSLQGGAYENNIFGFNRAALSVKLMSYLGYGQPNSDGTALVHSSSYSANVSLFPLLAYQKIYSDFFRFSQWESPNPSTFNVDWMTGNDDAVITSGQFTDFSQNTMFDLRYCNYQKDLFHGIMPNAQFGDTAAVPLGGSFSGTLNPVSPPSADPQAVNAFLSSRSANTVSSMTLNTTDSSEIKVSSVEMGTTGNGAIVSFPGFIGSPDFAVLPLSEFASVNQSGISTSSLSILALRQAEALQRWKEVAQAAEEDYKQQIQAHWGVNVSEYLSGMCRYLGGNSNNVQINEVVNTNLVAGDNSQPADLAGKGIGSQRGGITFKSNGEYGVIMCVYHALPLLDYITSGIDAKLLHVQGSSFPIPEMDNIGMELLPVPSLSNRAWTGTSGAFLGYVPRYVDWKTDYDRCVGAFASQGSKNLQSWILPYSDESLEIASTVGDSPSGSNPNVSDSNYLSYEFMKVNPHIVDPMFAVEVDSSVDTDHLLNQCFIKCYVTRNLDVNGLPY